MCNFFALSRSYLFYQNNGEYLAVDGEAERELAQLDALAKERPLSRSELHRQMFLRDTVAYYRLWLLIYSGKTGMFRWHCQTCIFWTLILFWNIALIFFLQKGTDDWIFLHVSFIITAYMTIMWIFYLYHFHQTGLQAEAIGNLFYPSFCMAYLFIFFVYFMGFFGFSFLDDNHENDPGIGYKIFAFILFPLLCVTMYFTGQALYNGFGISKLAQLPNPQIDMKPYEDMEIINFEHIPISHIFASPSERTVETAHGLLSKREDLKIKLEPGLIERLDKCLPKVPSYESCEELQKVGKFSKLDCTYSSLYTKILKNGEKADKRAPEFATEKFFLPMENEGATENEDDSADRMGKTLDYILKNYREGTNSNSATKKRKIEESSSNNGVKWLWPGEEAAEHIVVVSHMSPIGSIHRLISGQWTYPPLASISKFVEYEPTENPEEVTIDSGPSAAEGGTSHHHGTHQNVMEKAFKNFRLVFTSETSHLSAEPQHGRREL